MLLPRKGVSLPTYYADAYTSQTVRNNVFLSDALEYLAVSRTAFIWFRLSWYSNIALRLKSERSQHYTQENAVEISKAFKTRAAIVSEQ